MQKEFNYSASEKILGLLREIESNPQVTQRYLAKKHDVSLGKINFFVKVLLAKGIITVNNFKNSKNKMAYIYILTPNGAKLRFQLTRMFLEQKMREYKMLKDEIGVLGKNGVKAAAKRSAEFGVTEERKGRYE